MRLPVQATLLAIITMLILAACQLDDVGVVPPTATPAPSLSLNVDGELRNYELHVPDGERPEDGWPLVVVLHGLGSNASRIRSQVGFDQIADAEGFITAYPDGLARAWLDAGIGNVFADTDIASQNLAFIDALIDEIDMEYDLDLRRVYTTGLSNGGMFAFHTACHMSDRIAAVGLVAAASMSQSFNSCEPEEPVAYIAMHGTEDNVVPYDGGPIVPGIDSLGEFQSAHAAAEFWVAVNECTMPPTRTEIPDENESDMSRAFRETWSPCDSDQTVELITLEDAGHTWPGHQTASPRPGETNLDFDGTQVIWDFFEAHPKPDGS
jgi:polyhydroxybutyrate depolymerase